MTDSYEFLKRHKDRIEAEQRSAVEQQRDELVSLLRRIDLQIDRHRLFVGGVGALLCTACHASAHHAHEIVHADSCAWKQLDAALAAHPIAHLAQSSVTDPEARALDNIPEFEEGA